MQATSDAPLARDSGAFYWTEEFGEGEEVILFSRCAYATSRVGATTGYVALTDARLVFLGEAAKGGRRRLSLAYDEIESSVVGRRLNLAVSFGSMSECIVLRGTDGKDHTLWPLGVGVQPQTIRDQIDQQRLAIAV